MPSASIAINNSFRFDLALDYLRRSPDEILDIVEGQRHRRVLASEAGPSLIEITVEGAGEERRLQAKRLRGAATEREMLGAMDQIYLARSSADPGPVSEELGRMLQEYLHGLPVVQTLTPWEALVWAIIGQQINIAFAYRLKRAFVEAHGDSLTFEGSTFYAFPEPDRVADLDHERDLRPLKFSRQKSRYIIEAAKAVVRGELDFGRIGGLADGPAAEALQRQLGIGRWTAEYILLRGFGRLDVIPAGDAALKAGVGKHLGLERSASEDEVRRLSEGWRPRRGEIGFKLWFARQSGLFTY